MRVLYLLLMGFICLCRCAHRMDVTQDAQISPAVLQSSSALSQTRRQPSVSQPNKPIARTQTSQHTRPRNPMPQGLHSNILMSSMLRLPSMQIGGSNTHRFGAFSGLRPRPITNHILNFHTPAGSVAVSSSNKNLQVIPLTSSFNRISIPVRVKSARARQSRMRSPALQRRLNALTQLEGRPQRMQTTRPTMRRFVSRFGNSGKTVQPASNAKPLHGQRATLSGHVQQPDKVPVNNITNIQGISEVSPNLQTAVKSSVKSKTHSLPVPKLPKILNIQNHGNRSAQLNKFRVNKDEPLKTSGNALFASGNRETNEVIGPIGNNGTEVVLALNSTLNHYGLNIDDLISILQGISPQNDTYYIKTSSAIPATPKPRIRPKPLPLPKKPPSQFQRRKSLITGASRKPQPSRNNFHFQTLMDVNNEIKAITRFLESIGSIGGGDKVGGGDVGGDIAGGGDTGGEGGTLGDHAKTTPKTVLKPTGNHVIDEMLLQMLSETEGSSG